MLDAFIAGGYIPGTDAQLTFNEIMIGLPIILALFVLARQHPRVIKRGIVASYIRLEQLRLYIQSQYAQSRFSR